MPGWKKRKDGNVENELNGKYGITYADGKYTTHDTYEDAMNQAAQYGDAVTGTVELKNQKWVKSSWRSTHRSNQEYTNHLDNIEGDSPGVSKNTGGGFMNMLTRWVTGDNK